MAIIASAASAVCLVSLAQAQSTYTWDSGGSNPTAPVDGSGNWDTTSAKWSNGTADVAWPNDTSTAVFGNGGTAGTVNITTPLNAGGLTFNAVASGSYTISGQPLTLGGAAPAITLNTSATISAPLAGSAGMTTAGAGTLNLSGANTYGDGANGTIIGSGSTLQLGADNALPSGTNVFVNADSVAGTVGTLDLNGHNLTIGSLNGNINSIVGGEIIATPVGGNVNIGSGTLTIGSAGNNTLNGATGVGFFNGTLSGTGTFAVTGGQQIIWGDGAANGNNANFTGTYSVSNGGRLDFNQDGNGNSVIGAPTAINLSNSGATGNAGSTKLAFSTKSTNTFPSIPVNMNFPVAGDYRIEMNGSKTYKDSTGHNWAGAVIYNGPITISGAAGGAAIFGADGPHYDLYSDIDASNWAGGTIVFGGRGTSVYEGTITAPSTVNVVFTNTYGVAGGSGSYWNFQGLGNACTWGNTQIGAGVMTFRTSHTLPATTVVIMGQDSGTGTAEMNLHGWTQTIAGLTVADGNTLSSLTVTSDQGSQTLVIDLPAGADYVYGNLPNVTADIEGTQVLYVTGEGKQTLAANESYQGSTTIAGSATLAIGMDNTLPPTNPIFVGGGTLELDGYNQSAGTNSPSQFVVSSGVLGAVHFAGGAITGTGTLNATAGGNGVSYAFNGSSATGGSISAVLAGNGSLIKTGTETDTLSNANTYTGATNVDLGVLSVNSLADGGVASGIGASSNDASNLVMSGGSLQYTGPAASTDRLFTITPAGATIDASGTGPIAFSNTGAIVAADAAAVSGVFESNTSATVTLHDPTLQGNALGQALAANYGKVANLAVGQSVTGDNIPAGTTIVSTSISGDSITLSNTPTNYSYGANLSFGTFSPTLTLTGTNTDANTLAGSLSASAGGAMINLVKDGPGKWALPNNNTVASLTIMAGTLDLARGTLNIDYGANADPASTIFSYIQSAYDAGKWDSAGLTSSDAAGATALGYSDDTTNGIVAVRYTWYGDLDLNGVVNGADLAKMNDGQAGWEGGDLNYDGVVNGDDYALFMLGYSESGGQNISSVPEPAMLGCLGLAAGWLAARRRRQA